MVVVATHNLASGVLVGVVVAALVFARRVAHFVDGRAEPSTDAQVATYAVRGPLFFASSNDLVYQFDYAGDPDHVIIDLSGSQIYDSSTVAALDAIELKVPPARQDRRDRRTQRAEPGLARTAHRPAGWRSLGGTPRRLAHLDRQKSRRHSVRAP